jgi:hypothetical protein
MPIFTDVTNIEEQEEGKYKVAVRVKHAKMSPQSVYESRARLRALVAAGIVKSVEQGIADITKGQLNRLTDVQSNRRVTGGSFMITRIITVIVRKYRWDR